MADKEKNESADDGTDDNDGTDEEWDQARAEKTIKDQRAS